MFYKDSILKTYMVRTAADSSNPPSTRPTPAPTGAARRHSRVALPMPIQTTTFPATVTSNSLMTSVRSVMIIHRSLRCNCLHFHRIRRVQSNLSQICSKIVTKIVIIKILIKSNPTSPINLRRNPTLFLNTR